jgi:hypothetical protein
MKATYRLFVIATALVFSVSLARGQEGPDPSARVGKIPNWPAPETWSPHSVSRGVSTMDAVTSPLPFIGVTPFRLVDTRGNGAPIQGGMFTGGSDVRNYAVPLISGVSGSARALSLNFTVVGPTGSGFLVAWPTGGAVPPTAILNFNAGDVRNNAAVVPTNASVSFTVNVSAPTHVIIDVNGYYAPAGVGSNNTFLGLDAGNFTMTGHTNTGIGKNALFSNTTGIENTAVGAGALLSNTTGTYNTANGVDALTSNIMGIANTAIGQSALFNTDGSGNTAVGQGALYSNTTGGFNIAIGGAALSSNTTGYGNIALGGSAGINLTTGNNNICVGNQGVAGESNTIRIGDIFHTATFVAGINGAGVAGVPVVVSSSGQLGVASSSRHVKEDIRQIAAESDGLMRLRPVAFKYKPQIDPAGLAQYGLIAEEVADVYPDLVAYDRAGRPETVRYHLVNALLLNEVQKQHRTAEAQERTIEQQKAEIEVLTARLSRLEARLLTDLTPVVTGVTCGPSRARSGHRIHRSRPLRARRTGSTNG